MDAYARNMTRVFESCLFPSLARIYGLPHPIARRDIPANSHFTATYVYYIGVVFTHGYCAYRATKIAIGDVFPSAACIGGAPYATACRAEVVEIGLIRYACYGCRASAPKWTNAAPLYGIVERLVISSGFCKRCCCF